MITTPCPICHAPQMPEPPKRGRSVWVTCPACGTSCRASFSDTPGGVEVRYSVRKDHRKTVVRRVSVKLAEIMATRRFKEMVANEFDCSIIEL